MNYSGGRWSEEASLFIHDPLSPRPARRVLLHEKRQQKKKRLALVGASVAVMAVGAMFAYAVIPSGQSAAVATTEMAAQDADVFVIPEDDEDEGMMDANYAPAFEEVDTDGNGVVTTEEYEAHLAQLQDEALARLKASDESTEDKEMIAEHIKAVFVEEAECGQSLSALDQENSGEVTESRFNLFYSMIKEFCAVDDPTIPDVYLIQDIDPNADDSVLSDDQTTFELPSEEDTSPDFGASTYQDQQQGTATDPNDFIGTEGATEVESPIEPETFTEASFPTDATAPEESEDSTEPEIANEGSWGNEGSMEGNYIPLFDEVDMNGDGVVTTDEYDAYLTQLRDEALARLATSDESTEDKAMIAEHIKTSFIQESECAQSLAAQGQENSEDVTRSRFNLFYSMIKEFCAVNDPAIPDVYLIQDIDPNADDSVLSDDQTTFELPSEEDTSPDFGASTFQDQQQGTATDPTDFIGTEIATEPEIATGDEFQMTDESSFDAPMGEPTEEKGVESPVEDGESTGVEPGMPAEGPESASQASMPDVSVFEVPTDDGIMVNPSDDEPTEPIDEPQVLVPMLPTAPGISETPPNGWTKVDGVLEQISFDGLHLCGVTQAQDVYCATENIRGGSPDWRQLPGKLVHVVVYGDSIFAVTAQHKVVHGSVVTPDPHWVTLSGSLKQITTDGKQICGVNAEHAVYCADSNITTAPNWRRLPGDEEFENVELQNGKLVGTTTNHDILTGYASGKPKWKKLSGSLRQLTFDGVRYCGTNTKNKAYCANKRYLTTPNWHKKTGKHKYVVSEGGDLFGVSVDGNLFYQYRGL